jgi:hypothetical protein
MPMTKTTRRTLLTGALAAAATAPAVALTTTSDPIFDLIETQRRDWDAFSAAVDVCAANNEGERLCNVQCESFDKLFDFIPTTPAGHLAKWRYILIEGAEKGFSDEWYWLNDIDRRLLESFAAPPNG